MHRLLLLKQEQFKSEETSALETNIRTFYVSKEKLIGYQLRTGETFQALKSASGIVYESNVKSSFLSSKNQSIYILRSIDVQ